MRSSVFPVVLVVAACSLAWALQSRDPAPSAQAAEVAAVPASAAVLHVNVRRGGFVARGTVPDAGALAALAAEGVTGRLEALGAADGDWTRAALAGVAALRHLAVGQVELRSGALSILGTAPTPVEGEALRAAVAAALPPGYAVTYALSYQDDLTPPAYRLRYTVETGPYLEGKLPVGVGGAEVAAALGLADIDNGAQTALVGDPAAPDPALAAVRDWLPLAETLTVSVAPEGARVEIGLGAGWDVEAVQAALAAALPGVALRVVTVMPAGPRRQRALGGAEVLSNGYWLPEVEVPDAGCAGAGAAELSRVQSLAGDPRQPGALNALAGALRPCLAAGHRLALGNPALAEAVRARLPGAAIAAADGAPALVWQGP